MRAVVQRVTDGRVEVEGETVGEIERGLLVYLGVAKDDEEADLAWLAEKIATLRIFSDEAGKMNLSVGDVGGSVLVVSQFTLLADCRKGRRPAFDAAGNPKLANRLYEQFCDRLRAMNLPVATGVFAAYMKVTCTNDGPVTILLDSRKAF